MRNINAFKCFTLQHFHIIIQNQIKQSFTLLYLSKKTDTTLWLNQSHFCHFCPIFLHRWWVKQTHNLQRDLYRCLVLSGVFVCLYRKLLNGCSNDVKHGGVWCSGACSLKTHTHIHIHTAFPPSLHPCSRILTLLMFEEEISEHELRKTHHQNSRMSLGVSIEAINRHALISMQNLISEQSMVSKHLYWQDTQCTVCSDHCIKNYSLISLIRVNRNSWSDL